MSQPTPQSTTEREMPGLVEFICFAAYSTSHAFGRIYKPLLDELGLTYPQYLVMVVLWNSDGQTVGAIGQKVFLESNTLTPLLKRLEALGYVTRTRDTRDERQVLVHLTEKGRELRQGATKVPECLYDAMGLDKETLDRIRNDLVNLRGRLLNTAHEEA
jgi:DNA-binding MarR family transcriptional regulator